MDAVALLPTALLYAVAGWCIAGCILGLLGGFETIRRVAAGKQIRTWQTRLTLVLLTPVILLRAALWTAWEVTIGGAR